MVAADRAVLPPVSTLTLNGQRARYGVAYVRGICAQAGVGLVETSPDEDVLAVDCDVQFAEANVRVQVKCTKTTSISGRSIGWPLKDAWIRRWSDSLVPVYFVLVVVPSDVPAWLDHSADGTFHRTAAFWRRIEPGELSSRIAVSKRSRLTAATLDVWHSELLAAFTPAGAR